LVAIVGAFQRRAAISMLNLPTRKWTCGTKLVGLPHRAQTAKAEALLFIFRKK
jgi:hypothetical protein